MEGENHFLMEETTVEHFFRIFIALVKSKLRFHEKFYSTVEQGKIQKERKTTVFLLNHLDF